MVDCRKIYTPITAFPLPLDKSQHETESGNVMNLYQRKSLFDKYCLEEKGLTTLSPLMIGATMSQLSTDNIL